MYFPYFRGRQYDLLALKELAQKKLISNKVLPVVEPVKMSTTLNGTLKTFVDNELQLALILNPSVGQLSDEDYDNLYKSLNGYIIPAVIMDKNVEIVLDKLDHESQYNRDSLLVVLTNQDEVDKYNNDFDTIYPAYTLFPDTRSIRKAVRGKKVLFEDKFNKKNKNADYAINDDEFFSEDHLFYEEEGYTGFGDYSIIGRDFDDGGFAPRAVAIHIVYVDDKRNFRIHHFVSDSNHGIEDVAGKYYEALLKLKKWYENGNDKQRTAALSIFLEHEKNGYFPGLPTIKKLSIMHHLELVDRVLHEGR